MNKKALYKEIVRAQNGSATFKVQGWLRDNHPKLLAALRERFGIEGRQQVAFEHVHRWVHPKDNGNCETCGGPTEFSATAKAFKLYCSTNCVQNSPTIMAKKQATNMERRGVAWPTQSEEILRKVRKTTKARFGTEHAAQSAKAKRKVRATCIAKYGVPFVSQASEVMSKKLATGFRSYDMTLGRRTLRVMGYEDMAIRTLIDSLAVPQNAIDASDPAASFAYTHEARYRQYFTDLTVTRGARKLFVEVKSPYTAGLVRRRS